MWVRFSVLKKDYSTQKLAFLFLFLAFWRNFSPTLKNVA
jgi:hypothetical protein